MGMNGGMRMAVTEFVTLDSRQDGLRLALMLVRPEGTPRAIVQLAHGMCEHKERYAPFMEYLAERGCACVINDHRGHGASVRDIQDLGYFYEDGDRALTEDLHQITLWARERWPGIPLFLFGHSMGSLAVRAYCRDYDRDIDALVVCGSPGENPSAGFGLVLVGLLTLMKGDRYRSEWIRKTTTGSFSGAAKKRLGGGSWISANPENVVAYTADPLCNFTFTLNGYRALMRLMIRAYGIGTDSHVYKPERGRPDLPIHFYSGADDTCAPNRRGFENAMERMKKAGYTNVSGHMFPGLRHEILNEKNREEVFERIWSEALEPYI